MNSLAVYALGFELDAALAGASVAGVSRFPDGATIAFAGGSVPYLHILYHLREPELFPSQEAIAPRKHARRELAGAEGRSVRRVRPLGLERVLVIELGAGTGFGDAAGAYLRIDLTPAVRPLSYYEEGGVRPAASVGPRRARPPAGIADALPSKPYSLLALPAEVPSSIAAAAVAVPAPAGEPAHTRGWREARSLASALAFSVTGLDPDLAGAVARESRGDAQRAWPLVKEIARRVASGQWSWRRYRFAGTHRAGSASVYPVELPVGESGEAMPGFAEALSARAGETVIPAYAAHLRLRASRHARRELKRLERLRANLAEDLAEAGRSSEYRHFGELLATYRHLLRTGMREIVVKDFSGDRTVTISLDPARSPDRNVRLYFTKAKKGNKGALIIQNRKRGVESEIEKRRRELDALEALRSPADLIPLVPVETAQRERAAGSPEPSPFRRFPIDERHTAYVGRSDEENDALTHGFAAPTDLWFHAQDVPGSHVILRGAHRSTPATVIEQTAAIAAYFSKARSSRTVPVIYAEKRYVRRPRKSKPGTAVCQRGKTIFVAPGLPGGAEPK